MAIVDLEKEYITLEASKKAFVENIEKKQQALSEQIIAEKKALSGWTDEERKAFEVQAAADAKAGLAKDVVVK